MNDAARSAPDSHSSPSAAQFAGFLGATLLAVFFPVWIGRATFFYRDYALFGYPLAFYHKSCFWSGEWPAWNPFNNGGLPFLAQWNTLTLYPPSILYLLLPLPWSLSFFCLAHLFWAGLGARRLAWKWTRGAWPAAVAGLGFAWNGLALSCVKWPNNIAALAWAPWVIAEAESAWKTGGKKLWLAALLAAVQMLSGAPEVILLTWLFLAALCGAQIAADPKLRWRYAARLALLAACVGGLSAAQLLPFLELLAHSQRSNAFASGVWSMPLWGALNFVAPLFRCFPSHDGVFAQLDQYWISSYYPGIGVLLLAIVAPWIRRDRRACFLAAIIVAGALLALGSRAFVYSVAREVFPPLGVIRFPIKFVVWTSAFLPILAGIGLAQFRGDRRQLWTAAAILACAAAAAVAYGWAAPIRVPNWSAQQQRQTLIWNTLARAAFLLGFVLLLIWRENLPNPRRRILEWLWLVLMLADVTTHAPNLNPTVESWVYDVSSAKTPVLRMQTAVPTLGKARAMISPEAQTRLDHLLLTNAIQDVLISRAALFGDCNLIDAAPKTGGFYSLYLREESEFRARLQASKNPAALLDYLGVSQITAPGKIIDWTPRPTAMPLISSGQKIISVRSAQEALDRVFSPGFDPRREICVESSSAAGRENLRAAQLGISRVDWRRQGIRFETRSDKPGLASIAQAYYPGWRARIDGRPAPIYRANGAFQAVPIPAGAHQVELAFRNRASVVGGVISAIFLVALLVLLKFHGQPSAPRS